MLHAITASLKEQTQEAEEITYASLKLKLKEEATSNAGEYTPFLPSNPSCNESSKQQFLSLIINYLENKCYNNTVGDLAPKIIANALKLEIIILEECERGVAETAISPRTKQNKSVTILKIADHYNTLERVLDTEEIQFNIEMRNKYEILQDMQNTKEISQSTHRHTSTR